MKGSPIGKDLYAQFFLQRANFGQRHRASLKGAYIWMDWFSIPQSDFAQQRAMSISSDGAVPDGDMSLMFGSQWTRQLSSDMFIQRIPDYVEMSDMFVVLAPPCRHTAADRRCGFASWCRRGWCRLELWCKMMLYPPWESFCFLFLYKTQE